MRPKLLSPLDFPVVKYKSITKAKSKNVAVKKTDAVEQIVPIRAMVVRYIAVVMFAKITTRYPRESNDKSRAPAIKTPDRITATLAKPLLFYC